jgi:hypothetical protein
MGMPRGSGTGEDMGREPDPRVGSEPGEIAYTYIPVTARLDPNGFALVNVILAHPDTRLIDRGLDLETLRRQDLPDRSERHPGLIDTGANRSSITPDLAGSLGLQEDGDYRLVKAPSGREWKREPTFAVQLVFGGVCSIRISVTTDLWPPQGQVYKALIGCDALAMFRLTYEGLHSGFPGGDAGGYTLHVPDLRPRGT